MREIPEELAKEWENISKKSTVVPSVWFNPWQHQFEHDPLHALLHEMYNQFSLKAKYLRETGKISSVLLNTGLKLMKDLFKVDLTQVHHEGVTWEKKNYLTPLDSQRFPLYFEQAVKYLASYQDNKKGEVKDDARLLVFIDDLDRCQPCQAYKLLESIKLYLNTPHCVFVFGIDYQRLIKELAKEKDFDKSEQDAAEYLEKMFQAIIPLPVPRQEDYLIFIKEQVKRLGLSFDDTILTMLNEILEPNPRKTKNFINSLKLQYEITGKPEKKESITDLILIHYLRIYYPTVYTVVERDMDNGIEALYWAFKNDPTTTTPSQLSYYLKHLTRNELAWDISPDNKMEYKTAAIDDEMLRNMNTHTTTFKARKNYAAHFVNAFSDDKGQFNETRINEVSNIFHGMKVDEEKA